MKQFPNNIVYKKSHKQKTFAGNKGKNLSLFTVGIKAKSNCSLSYIQLESARRVMVRLLKPKQVKNKKNLKIIQSARKKNLFQSKKRRRPKRKNTILIKSNLTSPLTKKPLQVRMGKGKGNPYKYVSITKKSRVILELSRQKYKFRRMSSLLHYSALKLPTGIKFIFNKSFTRVEHNFKSNVQFFKGY